MSWRDPVLLGFVLTAVGTLGCAAHPAHAEEGARRPVVVELFSSEGCSSCPAADAVLAQLARTQPVAGAEILALELHVDYWNQLGWVDPFSDARYSARQRAYADAFGSRGVYTPQLVVDGQAELIGSRDGAARDAIAAAARAPKARVDVARAGGRLTVRVSGLGSEPCEVLLAVAEEGLKTDVPRGENAGRALGHGPAVRELRKLGTTSGPTFATETEVALRPAWKRENVRAVVFVQRSQGLAVVGAGALSMR